VPDGVDAAIHAMQPADTHPVSDRAGIDPNGVKLVARDDSVLAGGQPCEEHIDRCRGFG
jgi:hypothetical protein